MQVSKSPESSLYIQPKSDKLSNFRPISPKEKKLFHNIKRKSNSFIEEEDDDETSHHLVGNMNFQKIDL